uniref:DUF1997 domain-containing protein n=1 Tax=Cyanothece sp. (strain PCC 7425 / ATCC 29141) TaxID=395961 RepID=B8HKD0_CYAP4
MQPDPQPSSRDQHCSSEADSPSASESSPPDLATPISQEDQSPDLDCPPMNFQSQFRGCMELYAGLPQVMDYFDAHQGWFCRCAHPMKAEPLGENGYVLVIGRYGSFGYEVEPKIGLSLLPQQAGVYRIQTIVLPEQEGQNYVVDFQAAMHLSETELEASADTAKLGLNQLTQVDWHLDLGVAIHFPRFIYRLPKSLIQRTGDRLLAQIVKQVSQRLTSKVQDDFHSTLGVTLPKGLRRWWLKHH